MTTEVGCLVCGHNMSSHDEAQDPALCRVPGCYCGRNPLEGHHIALVECSWCSTSDHFFWAITPAGKRIPVEPEPNPKGNIQITMRGGVPFATIHGGPPGSTLFDDDDWVPFMPHHATCDKKLKDQNAEAPTP